MVTPVRSREPTISPCARTRAALAMKMARYSGCRLQLEVHEEAQQLAHAVELQVFRRRR